MNWLDIETLVAEAKAEKPNWYLLDKQMKDSGPNPYLNFLRLLAMHPKLPPGPILDLGVYHGTAPAHVCEAYHRHGRRYYGVDINFVPYAHPAFTLIQGDSNSEGVIDYLGKVTDRNPKTNYPEPGFSVIFQDSSHHFDPTVKEFETYFPMLKKGGVFICDDITPAFKLPEEKKGMVAYWDELPVPKENKRLFENLHIGSVMGVILK